MSRLLLRDIRGTCPKCYAETKPGEVLGQDGSCWPGCIKDLLPRASRFVWDGLKVEPPTPEPPRDGGGGMEDA